MFLSLLDLMRQQTGWPLAGTMAPAPLDWALAGLDHRLAGIAQLEQDMAGMPSLARAEWMDEGADLVLRVPLDGIDPISVQVQLTETTLTVAGHRTHEEQVEGEGFFRASASYGTFARTLPLPARVIPRQSRATWLSGQVLEIRLRKA